MFWSTAACAALIASTAASPLNSRASYAVKESHFVPSSWTAVEKASDDRLINLQIGLQQSKFKDLEHHLLETSDPLHERYGQHLSASEVEELIQPSSNALQAVHDWLADHGIESSDLGYSSAKDWIKVTLPVKKVETLLDTTYSVFSHEDGTKLIRTTEWSLPLHLHEHIATIQPTTSFLRPIKRGRKVKGWGPPVSPGGLPPPVDSASVAAVCNETLVTPLCLRTLYGTVNYTVSAAGKNKMALNDFLGEVNNRSDISIYLENFRPEAVAAAYEFQQVSIAGGTLQQTPDNVTQLQDGTGVEGDLDAETMLGIAWPTPLTTYSTGGLNPDFIPDLFTPTDSDEPYLVWLQYILSLPDSDLPSVVSSSYGDDEQTIVYSYAKQACDMFAQLGARGVTVIFSSGDEGVGADGDCFTNDGKNTSTFLPEFPATCPYVTAVGATYQFFPEVAAYDPRFTIPFTSGAGFSNYFPRPSYQDEAIPAYLSQYVGAEYAGLYNAAGRGIPDIAAQGVNFSTVWNGSVVPVDGTSASAPTAAAVLALVNDALIAAGKPTLGFFNPFLYKYGYKAFTDILSGSSAGCNTTGFPAAPGWDAVTGFGTPYLPDILATLGIGEKGGW